GDRIAQGQPRRRPARRRRRGRPPHGSRSLEGTMKKIILLVAAAFALAVPASGVAGPERAATGSTSFADSTGELSGGPDITNVTVGNDNAGLLTFTVAIPNRPGLMSDMAV